MRISDWSSDVCSSDLRRQQQDEHGGLQVKTPGGWIAAPPLPGTLVCNIGDMLDRLTGGWYLSTPHRVRNDSGRERLSFPLFFDPDFAAEMVPLPPEAAKGHGASATPSRSEEHTSELQSLMRNSYAVFCLKKKTHKLTTKKTQTPS